MRFIVGLVGIASPIGTGFVAPTDLTQWVSWLAGVVVAVVVVMERVIRLSAIERGGVVLPDSQKPRTVATPPLTCPLDGDRLCLCGPVALRALRLLRAVESKPEGDGD